MQEIELLKLLTSKMYFFLLEVNNFLTWHVFVFVFFWHDRERKIGCFLRANIFLGTKFAQSFQFTKISISPQMFLLEVHITHE